MSSLGMIRDLSGLNTFGLPFNSDYQYSTTLATGVAQTLTIPASPYVNNKWLAIFSPQVGSSIWIANNATAAIPGASFAAATSKNNPTARMVSGGDVLSFITADNGSTIGVELYALGQ